MGGIAGMLGVGGGAGGSGFSGPQGTRIQSPATTAQANEQYKNVQDALAQQQAFVQATQAQNGLGNQTNVLNQLQGVANGTGPNPAQAQLAQATGANVANQAALMAGQRGANANVGLLARQAAQQGAQTQQQAAGQAATLQAEQSLNALQGMGNLATQQVGQQQSATQGYSQAAQGAQSNILNSIAGTNQANVSMQNGINSANAGLAGARLGQQGNIIGNIANGAGSALGLAEGGIVPMYADGGGVYVPIDPNAPDVFDGQNSIPSQPPATQPPAGVSKGPKSSVGKHFQFNMDSSQQPNNLGSGGQMLGKAIGTGLKSLFSSSSEDGSNDDTQQAYLDADSALSVPGMNNSTDMDASNYQADFAAAHGGKVPALVSPGEQYLPPKAVKKVVKDGKNPLKVGERIPGKPKVKGNSYANDTVPKNLESGGIVIPNSVMQSKDPAHEAYKFIQAIQAKHGKSLPKKKA